MKAITVQAPIAWAILNANLVKIRRFQSVEPGTEVDFLMFDEETQEWESTEDWLRIVSQKPLRCVVVGMEEVAA